MVKKSITKEGKFKLGEMLVKYGYISEENLKEALKRAFQSKGRLGSNLIKLGYIDEELRDGSQSSILL